jgi:ABC-type nitrate/sulfonate/bicarbonate transport system substrate-binding protein
MLPVMTNPVKQIGKDRFQSRRPLRRRRAARAARPAVVRPPVAAARDERAPVLVGRTPLPTATGLAHQLGWLASEAALDGTPLTTAGDPLAAALRDPRSLATAARDVLREGDVHTALWARAAGEDSRLLGLASAGGFQALMTAPDSGIRRLDQLAGRRIGLPFDPAVAVDAPRAAARRALTTALGLAGLFPEDVREVDVRADAHEPHAGPLAALRRGTVDVVHVAGAAGLAAAAHAGAALVIDLGAHRDPVVRSAVATPIAVTANARLLAERPQLVLRLLAVLLRAGAWARTQPDDATRLLAADLGSSGAQLALAHGPDLTERLLPGLEHRELTALHAHHDVLRTYGFLASDVDLGGWVDPRPLAAARDLLAAELTAWV